MTPIESLRVALGDDCIRTGTDIGARHQGDWLVKAGPDDVPLALALPRDTQDVSTVLRICHAAGIPVVPQGGLTGLTGGAVPVRGAVLLSLERLRAIEEVDPIAGTITVQAGVPLQSVQEAADAADMLFPLDIGGRGSCLIGGNLSTNAGGNRVLRYGMARDLLLGIEAVLADGTVITSLNKMLKNNAAYDLKQLFVGSEGTLGIITRAVLRLFPKPVTTNTALCAFDDFDRIYDFLRSARAHLGGTLSAFETMWQPFYVRAIEGKTRPLGPDHIAYVLVESMGTDPSRDADHFSALIEQALEAGVVADAVVAQSLKETRQLWDIRDSSGELVQKLKPVGNYDVSVPTGRIQAFVIECSARLAARWPGAETICFGHLADSNLHMFVKVPATPFPEDDIDAIVYGCVRDWRGSISAEHGIGLLKKAYLDYSRTPEEIALMKTLRHAMDPKGILNPGKIFEA
jgi:FAD/FMN-containing dehydrogenase